MEVTKQTAVQWLFDNLKSHFEHDGDLLEIVQFSFEQAKEMEKQQIKDAWDSAYTAEGFFNAEQYYNETYGKAN
jgi:hypothetical protein